MSVADGAGIEQLYTEYLNAVRGVKVETRRAVQKIWIPGVIIGIVGMTSYLWATEPVAVYGMPLGVAVIILTAIMDAVAGYRFRKREVARIADDKAGFGEFARLYRWQYWPRPMARGRKLDRFRSIVEGGEASER